MKNYLTTNQRMAFEKFSFLKVGALFMEMGTGKTRTALELIKYNESKVDKAIWFTPFSTKNNLQQELLKWDILKIPIEIIGWETLSMSDKKYLDLLKEIKNKKLFIVADESIFIKNNETKRYQRLMNIAKMSEYRLLLNGTPITKNEWDIYYQMNFLSPKIFNMNESEFRNTFFTEITYKKSNMGKAKTFYKLSEVNIEYLHKLINPYVFKCDFIFELKETEQSVLIAPGNETLEEYEKIKNNTLENLANMNSESIILLLNRLNHISCRDLNKALEIAKYAQNKQVIIFCNYISEINVISNNLKECYIITGNTKDRNFILSEFEKNNIPLLMTMGTGSYGLNLQFCNEIVFSSLTFDYSKVLQAKARIRRIGQEQDITYTYFDVDLPINKFISNNIEKKEHLADLLLNKLKENDAKDL